MQVLNLTNIEKSDIKYTISHFPDGEVQITLGEFSHKDEVNVRCRITSTDDLFILMQVNDILTRHEVQWNLHIVYLMGMRMDRVMDFNRPFTLKIIINVLKNFSCSYITVTEPHSYRTISLLDSKGKALLSEHSITPDCIVVFPDREAYERYGSRFNDRTVIICSKVRNVATGELCGFKVENSEELLGFRKCLIIDDLCDRGDTFCGIASEIRKVNPDIELNIFVTHMVNLKGIENLSKTFNHVYFTNSYKDWNGYKAEYGKAVSILPENVTQIEVI